MEIHVCFYNIDDALLIQKFIDFINKHEGKAFLSFHGPVRQQQNQRFFDKFDLTISLYYYEELGKEIDSDEYLSLYHDCDCFDIDQSGIESLSKTHTPKTIDLLLKLSALNKIYYDLINGNFK